MNKRNYFVIFLGLILVLLTPGCTVNLGGTKTNVSDGGIWRSADGGKIWTQNVSVPTINGKIVTIGNADIRRIIFDPSDGNVIYLATENNGIIYSYDGGNSWQQFKQLNKGKIYSVAVDSRDKCNLYALVENRLYKSTDCGRAWDVAYFHQNASVALVDLVVDYNNPSIIYMVDSVGEIMKSINAGQSWNTVYREKNNALFYDVVMSPTDSRIVYAGTLTRGIYKTMDGGINWSSLGDGLKSYSGSMGYKKLIIDEATPNGLIFISKFGMLRSRDGGNTWEIVKLLPASGSAVLYSVAVNPKNSQEIYYTTATTLVKTTDGGSTWSSQKLPFSNSRIANFIVVSPINSSVVYIGTKAISDK